jgi:hypothetical protein
MADFLNWSWTSAHVQTEVVNGEYITSEAALIAAGPPRLDNITNPIRSLSFSVDIALNNAPIVLQPIGLLSNFQMNQNRNVNRLFEIGSARAYMIPGRHFAAFSMGRIMFFGPSLLRMLYAWYPDTNIKFPHGKFTAGTKISNSIGPGGSWPTIGPEDAPGFGPKTANEVGQSQNKDGSKNNADFWINLTSIVFRQSLGLALLLKASNNTSYGAVYLEDCMLEGHGFGLDANNVVITEAVNGQFDRVRPIHILGV